jgi:hypothetical protein
VLLNLLLGSARHVVHLDEKKNYEILRWGNLKEREYLECHATDGRAILKWIIKDRILWSAFISFRVGASVGPL